MRYFILISFLLVGCGAISRSCTRWTGDLTYKCSKRGTEYVQSDSGIAVSVDKDGTVVGCEK
jgi:hypothetical protein